MLYAALYSWLVGPGKPLNHLFYQRLPLDSLNALDVALLTLQGTSPTSSFGSTDLRITQSQYDALTPDQQADYIESGTLDGSPAYARHGISSDSGVLWFHSGLVFQARAKDYELVLGAHALLDSVRDRMLILKDGDTPPQPPDLTDPAYSDWGQKYGAPASQSRLVHCEETSDVSLLEQDPQGRLILQLQMEIWHQPVRRR